MQVSGGDVWETSSLRGGTSILANTRIGATRSAVTSWFIGAAAQPSVAAHAPSMVVGLCWRNAGAPLNRVVRRQSTKVEDCRHDYFYQPYS